MAKDASAAAVFGHKVREDQKKDKLRLEKLEKNVEELLGLTKKIWAKLEGKDGAQ